MVQQPVSTSTAASIICLPPPPKPGSRSFRPALSLPLIGVWSTTGPSKPEAQDVCEASNDPQVDDQHKALPSFLKLTKAQIHAKFVDLEWQQRERQNVTEEKDGIFSQWARLDSEEITKRNRYYNVDPYASNRVRLRVPDGQVDYINASPIRLPASQGSQKYFIATQGPKDCSVNHFWRMVWDETANPAVIVMLTQTLEASREKCAEYFPVGPAGTDKMTIREKERSGDDFTATLRLLECTHDTASNSTIRKIELQTPSGSTKLIWHFLFAGWPDFLVPEGSDRTALLNLITLSQQKQAGNEAFPRIVHCSAGVGRTGTFIALDWLLNELDAGALDNVPDDQDPIFDLVARLRMQRMMMVQGDVQFVLLYDLIRDKWLSSWKTRKQAGQI